MTTSRIKNNLIIGISLLFLLSGCKKDSTDGSPGVVSVEVSGKNYWFYITKQTYLGSDKYSTPETLTDDYMFESFNNEYQVKTKDKLEVYVAAQAPLGVYEKVTLKIRYKNKTLFSGNDVGFLIPVKIP